MGVVCIDIDVKLLLLNVKGEREGVCVLIKSNGCFLCFIEVYNLY